MIQSEGGLDSVSTSAAQPAIALFLGGLAYVVSGPLLAMRRHHRDKNIVLEENEPVSP